MTPRKPAKRARKLHPEAACAFQRQFSKIEQVTSRITYAHLWLAFEAGARWQRRQKG